MENYPWKITLSDIDISKREESSLMKALRSGWLSMGEMTKKFEDEFKRLHRVKHAFAVSNGTAALHLANLALGIKPGDEVICPSLTFVATANSVLYVGAKVVFADITSFNNLNISPCDIRKKINSKTKAIIVVHYAGYPCDMEKITSLASKHNLHIIEDCAHAPLTRYNGKYLGTYGDIGCFSFFPNKNMTTAEGGMIVTNDDKLAMKIKHLRSHGMTSLTLDRHKGHCYTYDVVTLGFNYRIDEIRSAIGLAQLGRLPGFNKKRRQLVKYYCRKLKNIEGVELIFEGFDLRQSSCHIFPILLKNNTLRDSLQKFLKAAGIQTSIHYPPVHNFSYYRSIVRQMPLLVTEKVALRVLTLPLYPKLKYKQIDYIVNKIKDYIKLIKESSLQKGNDII